MNEICRFSINIINKREKYIKLQILCLHRKQEFHDITDLIYVFTVSHAEY